MTPGRKLTPDTLIRILRRRAWLLAAPLVPAVVAGLLYARSRPDLFRSDAVVLMVSERIPDAYVQSSVTAGVEERVASIAQQVLSRTQLEAVIRTFDLYPRERESLPMEEVFGLMRKRIAVEPLAGEANKRLAGEAFRVSFDHEDPRVACDVAAALAGFFIDRNAAERGAQADQTSAFLQAELAEARARLEAQERKLRSYRERNSGRLPTQTQTNLQVIQNAQSAMQATSESLARDRDRKLILERLYADAESSSPQPAPPQEGRAPAVPAGATAQRRLEEARAALAEMQTRLTDKHPDIVQSKATIADLERQAAKEGGTDGSPANAGRPTDERLRRDARLRELRAEIERLDGQIAFKEGEERRRRNEIEAYQARLEAVPQVESELIALTRDYDSLETNYKELLKKSENSKVAASFEQRQIGERFRILDPPRVPAKPHGPNRLLINLAAASAGLGLGVLLLAFAEYRDSTMHSEADALAAVELPVIAVLPFVATPSDLRRKRRFRIGVSAAAALGAAATGCLFWYLQLWKFVF